ncbi:hypothetical protein PENSPDRAFT_369018 [Peniophora sp. CONT]|nr:hypothetical protein PENSPDRAFT_369018 [Peniophora sp. CONT]
MLDEQISSVSNRNATSTTHQAAVRTQSTVPTLDAALVLSRISQLIAEARSLNTSFKYPREPIFLDSGELDPKAPVNEPLLEYRALLRAYTVTVTRISGDDSGLSQYQHAVIRELGQFVGICERWIRTASCLYLGKVRGKTPSAKLNRKASTTRVVIELDLPSSSTKRVADAGATGEKRKRDPLEVNDRESQPFEEREDVDVKPIIKPDPDALVSKDKSSSKTRLLQAKKAVQEAELAVQQKKLELSLTDLAIVEEEETREAKRRRIGMAHAIDLTLD